MATEQPSLLIVEDDVGLQKQLRWCFGEYRVHVAADREQTLTHIRRFEPTVVLQDLGLPPDPNGVSEGFKTLRAILAAAPFAKVIVVTGHGDQANAVRAVSLGATDFCNKPVDRDVLKLIVARAFKMHELEKNSRELSSPESQSPLEGVITSDTSMLQICRAIAKVAPSDVPVLIVGDTGTGKELLARAVHRLSDRKACRFVPINCAAIPEHLLEAELFGHEKGAFTGAIKQTIGKIELANKGTLFLDEIGDMPLAIQPKLLRFLQDGVLERLGGRTEVSLDVRLVCATNRDLGALIAAQQFREDLYYRISAVPINVPSLRERGMDAIVLAQALLVRLIKQLGARPRQFSPEALAALTEYTWPGNVRELENKIKAAIIMAEGSAITPEDLKLQAPRAGLQQPNLATARTKAERDVLIQALALTENNHTHAANLLGITRPTLYSLMARCQLRVPPTKPPSPLDTESE